jgi:hypothetical protein
MSNESDAKHPQIHTDDDWKARVKAEDASLDQQFRETPSGEEKPAAEPAQTKSTGREAKSVDPRLFPPADFPTLIGMFSTQAMFALGLIPNPATGKTEVQPELARHFIDLLGVLEEKTKGNLSPAEDSLLETTLHELRMAYVDSARRPAPVQQENEATST